MFMSPAYYTSTILEIYIIHFNQDPHFSLLMICAHVSQNKRHADPFVLHRKIHVLLLQNYLFQANQTSGKQHSL